MWLKFWFLTLICAFAVAASPQQVARRIVVCVTTNQILFETLNRESLATSRHASIDRLLFAFPANVCVVLGSMYSVRARGRFKLYSAAFLALAGLIHPIAYYEIPRPKAPR